METKSTRTSPRATRAGAQPEPPEIIQAAGKLEPVPLPGVGMETIYEANAFQLTTGRASSKKSRDPNDAIPVLPIPVE